MWERERKNIKGRDKKKNRRNKNPKGKNKV